MKFRLRADAVFEADDLDDAFRALSEHFEGLIESGENDLPMESGGIEIDPVPE